MTQADERRRLDDLKKTAWALLCATIVGLAFVALRYCVVLVTNGWRSATGTVFIALMWALAWFVAGFLFGFLFGIPKVPQNGKTDAHPGESTDENAPQEVPYQLRVNTNLEEISDWLTKMLVGATLTQLVKVPSKINDAARFMAEGAGGIGSQTFAASILVYFSSLGFFAGYVLTRMFFAGAFVRSDSQLSVRDIGKLQGARITLDPLAPAPPDEDTLQTAAKTRAIPITDSLTAGVAAAVATGAILMGDIARAVQASKLAVDKSPDDPRAHLNYAIALYRSNADSSLVKKELERAHEIVTAGRDAAVVEDICNSIVYFYLYLPPPEGFTKAIEYGEAYLKTNTPSRVAIWINLACAYGQKYAYLQSSGGTTEQLQPVKDKAFQYVQNAINMNPNSAVRFRQLTTGIPDPDDDDLKVFAPDDQFKRLVGLS